MAHLRVRHLDFWSLDVEGGELSVLRTFNFQQVGACLPAAVNVELVWHHSFARAAVHS